MYYDLLSKIQNAERARKPMFRVPFSNMDFAVLKILVQEKFLKEIKKRTFEKKHFLEIELLPEGDEHQMRGFKLKGRPSRRLYVGYRGLRAVQQGFGVGVLSTPNGIMTTKEARKKKVGGEYLFEIW